MSPVYLPTYRLYIVIWSVLMFPIAYFPVPCGLEYGAIVTNIYGT